MSKLSKNKVVSVVLLDGTDQLVITGPYGHAVCKADNPVEIGLHVCEVLTGDTLAPPAPHYARETPSNVVDLKKE